VSVAGLGLRLPGAIARHQELRQSRLLHGALPVPDPHYPVGARRHAAWLLGRHLLLPDARVSK